MNSNETPAPRLHEVRRRFDRVAADATAADFAFDVCREGLLERLLPMQIDAKQVLVLGSGSGQLSRILGKRFRGSRILSLDLSHDMLEFSRRARSRFARAAELQANAEAIPLLAASVDVVIANLLLPWVAEPPQVFREVARVLKKDGLFAFSALGPDSIAELRRAFDDDTAHVRRFADMHDIGDALLRSGLRDPVLDVDLLHFDYKDTQDCFRDLTLCGARNTLTGRRKTLTSKGRFQAGVDSLRAQMSGQQLRLSLELVYGHAWGGAPPSADGEFRISVDELRGRRR